MDSERSSVGYWVTAIIVVLAIAVAAWWYTGTNPSIPNTGIPENTVEAVN